jgi:hypothetical protein
MSEIKKFEVWCEGYLATGMEGIPMKARCEGTWEGKDFSEACQNYANSLEQPELFNTENNEYWGIQLFDNEVDARKQFGY